MMNIDSYKRVLNIVVFVLLMQWSNANDWLYREVQKPEFNVRVYSSGRAYKQKENRASLQRIEAEAKAVGGAADYVKLVRALLYVRHTDKLTKLFAELKEKKIENAELAKMRLLVELVTAKEKVRKTMGQGKFSLEVKLDVLALYYLYQEGRSLARLMETHDYLLSILAEGEKLERLSKSEMESLHAAVRFSMMPNRYYDPELKTVVEHIRFVASAKMYTKDNKLWSKRKSHVDLRRKLTEVIKKSIEVPSLCAHVYEYSRSNSLYKRGSKEALQFAEKALLISVKPRKNLGRLPSTGYYSSSPLSVLSSLRIYKFVPSKGLLEKLKAVDSPSAYGCWLALTLKERKEEEFKAWIQRAFNEDVIDLDVVDAVRRGLDQEGMSVDFMAIGADILIERVKRGDRIRVIMQSRSLNRSGRPVDTHKLLQILFEEYARREAKAQRFTQADALLRSLEPEVGGKGAAEARKVAHGTFGFYASGELSRDLVYILLGEALSHQPDNYDYFYRLAKRGEIDLSGMYQWSIPVFPPASGSRGAIRQYRYLKKFGIMVAADDLRLDEYGKLRGDGPGLNTFLKAFYARLYGYREADWKPCENSLAKMQKAMLSPLRYNHDSWYSPEADDGESTEFFWSELLEARIWNKPKNYLKVFVKYADELERCSEEQLASIGDFIRLKHQKQLSTLILSTSALDGVEFDLGVDFRKIFDEGASLLAVPKIQEGSFHETKKRFSKAVAEIMGIDPKYAAKIQLHFFSLLEGAIESGVLEKREGKSLSNFYFENSGLTHFGTDWNLNPNVSVLDYIEFCYHLSASDKPWQTNVMSIVDRTSLRREFPLQYRFSKKSGHVSFAKAWTERFGKDPKMLAFAKCCMVSLLASKNYGSPVGVWSPTSFADAMVRWTYENENDYPDFCQSLRTAFLMRFKLLADRVTDAERKKIADGVADLLQQKELDKVARHNFLFSGVVGTFGFRSTRYSDRLLGLVCSELEAYAKETKHEHMGREMVYMPRVLVQTGVGGRLLDERSSAARALFLKLAPEAAKSVLYEDSETDSGTLCRLGLLALADAKQSGECVRLVKEHRKAFKDNIHCIVALIRGGYFELAKELLTESADFITLEYELLRYDKQLEAQVERFKKLLSNDQRVKLMACLCWVRDDLRLGGVKKSKRDRIAEVCMVANKDLSKEIAGLRGYIQEFNLSTYWIKQLGGRMPRASLKDYEGFSYKGRYHAGGLKCRLDLLRLGYEGNIAELEKRLEFVKQYTAKHGFEKSVDYHILMQQSMAQLLIDLLMTEDEARIRKIEKFVDKVILAGFEGWGAKDGAKRFKDKYKYWFQAHLKAKPGTEQEAYEIALIQLRRSCAWFIGDFTVVNDFYDKLNVAQKRKYAVSSVRELRLCYFGLFSYEGSRWGRLETEKRASFVAKLITNSGYVLEPFGVDKSYFLQWEVKHRIITTQEAIAALEQARVYLPWGRVNAAMSLAYYQASLGDYEKFLIAANRSVQNAQKYGKKTRYSVGYYGYHRAEIMKEYGRYKEALAALKSIPRHNLNSSARKAVADDIVTLTKLLKEEK